MGSRVDTHPRFGHFEGLTAASASYLMLRCSVSSYLAVTAISEMPISNIPIYFRKDDVNAIISAARLKVMKACMSKSLPEREECIDQVLNRIHHVLSERISEPGGDTE